MRSKTNFDNTAIFFLELQTFQSVLKAEFFQLLFGIEEDVEYFLC